MKKVHLIAGFLLIVMFFLLASCGEETTSQVFPKDSGTPSHIPRTTLAVTHSSVRPSDITKTVEFSIDNLTQSADVLTQTAFYVTETAQAKEVFDDCNGSPARYQYWVDNPINYSPSGNWHIAYCMYPETGGSYTRVINLANNVAWEVPYLNHEGQNLPEGADGGQMEIVAWSSDEKSAFFVRYICCADGPGLTFTHGDGLYRLNLINGDIQEVISVAPIFSFSPNSKYLVRFDRDTKKVVIENLETEKTSSYAMYQEFDFAIGFRWSLDNSKVVFTATDEYWDITKRGSAIYLIDLNDRKLKLLAYRPQELAVAESWISNSAVLLTITEPNWPIETTGNSYYVLNTKSFNLTPYSQYKGTQTPLP